MLVSGPGQRVAHADRLGHPPHRHAGATALCPTTSTQFQQPGFQRRRQGREGRRRRLPAIG